MHKPSWYQDGNILIVNSRTCGINKDGHEQYIVDLETGVRSNNAINDTLAEACEQIKAGDFSRSDTRKPLSIFKKSIRSCIKSSTSSNVAL